MTEHTPPETGGRGADLLTCGDIESNPGPVHEDMQEDPDHYPLTDQHAFESEKQVRT